MYRPADWRPSHLLPLLMYPTTRSLAALVDLLGRPSSGIELPKVLIVGIKIQNPLENIEKTLKEPDHID